MLNVELGSPVKAVYPSLLKLWIEVNFTFFGEASFNIKN
jgi:hypothetical protein